MKSSSASVSLAGRPAAQASFNATLVAATLQAQSRQHPLEERAARAASPTGRRFVQAVDGCLVPIEDYVASNYEGYHCH